VSPQPIRLPLSPRQADALTALLEMRLGAELIAELGADGVQALREVAGKLDTLKEQ
jgi:hypothetical protein